MAGFCSLGGSKKNLFPRQLVNDVRRSTSHKAQRSSCVSEHFDNCYANCLSLQYHGYPPTLQATSITAYSNALGPEDSLSHLPRL